jgi:DNA-directed RNA polymerase subunit RPC12/RpoP
MDLIFNCPKCEQELAVDASGAGEEIECPECGQPITIPMPDSPGVKTSAAPVTTAPVETSATNNDVASTVAASAAARIKKNLKVPVTANPAAKLIAKPATPLEVAAKASDRKMRIKCIRHNDCVEVGHDRFEEVVTEFLGKIGEVNIVSIHPINYSYVEMGSQRELTDFGVMIVFKA